MKNDLAFIHEHLGSGFFTKEEIVIETKTEKGVEVAQILKTNGTEFTLSMGRKMEGSFDVSFRIFVRDSEIIRIENHRGDMIIKDVLKNEQVRKAFTTAVFEIVSRVTDKISDEEEKWIKNIPFSRIGG